MPTVWIPALMRDLSGNHDSMRVAGTTLIQVIDALDIQCPGIKTRLLDGDSLRAGLAVVIDGQVARGGLMSAVAEESEVHFIPAIGGGGR